MPPKGSRRGRGRKTVNPDPAPAAPSQSEDAKPDVEQLNANLEASHETATNDAGPLEHANEALASDQTLPSDPLRPPPPYGLPLPTSPPPVDPIPAPATASPTPRGRASKAAQPRGTRRSAAQRAELAAAADERNKAESAVRAAEAAKAVRWTTRARGDGGRRGRGRGGFMGQNDRGEQDAVVSGPFSGGQVHRDSRHIKRGAPSSGWKGLSTNARPREEESRPSGRRSWSHMGQSKGSGGTTTTVKAEPGSSGDAKPALDRDGDMPMHYVDGGYISSDEEDGPEEGMKRVNIEDFGVIDLTQDDEDERGYYAPVRVMRVERKDRSAGVNAEGATNQDGEVAVGANDSVSDPTAAADKKGKQKAAAAVQPSQDQKSFQAVYSDSDDNTAQVEPQVKPDPDPIEPTDDTPSSLSSRRKGKERAKAARASSPALAAPGAEYQTREDLQEWERSQNDLRIMRSELGDPADRDDTAMDGTEGTADSRADKVYLFQFPPVLPHLLPDTVSSAAADAGAIVADTAPSTSGTDANPPVKLEPITSNDASFSPSFPSGAVGKLRVRASGRVELDWGGTAMEMGLGTEAGFLQDLMLVTLPEGKGNVNGGEAVQTEAEAVSMGRVRGKFVVVPEWGALLS